MEQDLELGLIVVVLAILALLSKSLRQPLVVGYLFAGLLVGPAGFGFVREEAFIRGLADLGVSLLLFTVGLELALRRWRAFLKPSLICGLSQVFVVLVFTLAFSNLFLGLWGLELLCFAFALTISSTMIGVKFLSDAHELDTIHGRMALGTLLIQDVLAILFLAALFGTLRPLESVVAISGLLGLTIVFYRFSKPLLRNIVGSAEVTILFSLGVCCLFSLIASSFGLSIAVGSFLAGLALAVSPYNLQLVSATKPLRDFFVAIFFTSLGMELGIGLQRINLWDWLPQLLSLVGFVSVGQVLLVMIISKLLGHALRTAFILGIVLAQASEFSLVIASEAQKLGIVSWETFSLTTIVVMLTFVVSSYVLSWHNRIYRRLLPLLKRFDALFPKPSWPEDVALTQLKGHIVLVGCHRIGTQIARSLRALGKGFVVVDFNPEVVGRLMAEGIPVIYGDINDPEVLVKLNLKEAEFVISTIPDHDLNLRLIKEVKVNNPKAIVFTTAYNKEAASELYARGSDYVILPHQAAGEKVANFLMGYYKRRLV